MQLFLVRFLIAFCIGNKIQKIQHRKQLVCFRSIYHSNKEKGEEGSPLTRFYSCTHTTTKGRRRVMGNFWESWTTRDQWEGRDREWREGERAVSLDSSYCRRQRIEGSLVIKKVGSTEREIEDGNEPGTTPAGAGESLDPRCSCRCIGCLDDRSSSSTQKTRQGRELALVPTIGRISLV